jgi:uncharacterized protein (TIGR02246 family)
MSDEWVEAAVAVQQAWTRAFEARDLCALSALYAEETAFYGSTAALYTTPAGVRTYFEILPLSYKRSDYAVPYVVWLGEDAMAATGEVTFYREETDGTMTALPFRMTHVLVRRDGGWKIATHHASPRPPS